ncbi:hypothetical protein TNCV_3266681 [Trichonephila clavipes]|nr:hypothetical protein TNCV_3266681 [Trichonephila clavipes]
MSSDKGRSAVTRRIRRHAEAASQVTFDAFLQHEQRTFIFIWTRTNYPSNGYYWILQMTSDKKTAIDFRPQASVCNGHMAFMTE